MNPLGNNPGGGLPPNILNNIKQIKGLMNNKSNPILNQVLQICNGQNPEQVFRNMCRQRGIDPEAILRELRN